MKYCFWTQTSRSKLLKTNVFILKHCLTWKVNLYSRDWYWLSIKRSRRASHHWSSKQYGAIKIFWKWRYFWSYKAFPFYKQKKIISLLLKFHGATCFFLPTHYMRIVPNNRIEYRSLLNNNKSCCGVQKCGRTIAWRNLWKYPIWIDSSCNKHVIRWKMIWHEGCE